MNPLSAATAESRSRSTSPVPQRAAAVESSALSGGGGGDAVDTSSSLDRTHGLAPVAPHGLGSHAETLADAATLRGAEVVGSGGVGAA